MRTQHTYCNTYIHTYIHHTQIQQSKQFNWRPNVTATWNHLPGVCCFRRHKVCSSSRTGSRRSFFIGEANTIQVQTASLRLPSLHEIVPCCVEREKNTGKINKIQKIYMCRGFFCLQPFMHDRSIEQWSLPRPCLAGKHVCWYKVAHASVTKVKRVQVPVVGGEWSGVVLSSKFSKW